MNLLEKDRPARTAAFRSEARPRVPLTTSTLFAAALGALCVGVPALGLAGWSVALGGVAMSWLGLLAVARRGMIRLPRAVITTIHSHRLALLSDLADDALDSLTHDVAPDLRRLMGDDGADDLGPASEYITLVEARIAARRSRRSAWHGGGEPEIPRALSEAARGRAADRAEPRQAPRDLIEERRLWPRTLRSGTLGRVRAILNGVGHIHSERTEWSVLLFTFWARLVLVGSAPAMASLTGLPSLTDMSGLARSVWGTAFAWSFMTAAASPWIADRLMGSSGTGGRTGSGLTAIELPIAVALTIASPSWAGAVFWSGIVNYLQRPTFGWRRLAGFVIVVAALLALGLGIRESGDLEALIQIAAGLAILGATAGSYGALLPWTLAALAESLLAAVWTRPRARMLARADASSLADRLFDAAHELERRNTPTEPRDVEMPVRLRRSAEALKARSRRRWKFPHASRTVPELFRQAARRAGAPPARDDGGGRSEIPDIEVLPPSFDAAALRRVRLRRRRDARTLSMLLATCIKEARRHGEGELLTNVARDHGKVIVRLSNFIPSEPRPPGRGRGGHEISTLAEALPGGKLDFRGRASGAAIGLDSDLELFEVKFSFELSAFESEAI